VLRPPDYPIYPLARRGGLVQDEVMSYDVEDEVSARTVAPGDRFQSFRMSEYVRIGTPQPIQAFPRALIARAQAIDGFMGLS